MKKRSQIDNKYKWDLSHLCNSDDEAYNQMLDIAKRLPMLKEYQGKLGTKDKLLEFYNLSHDIYYPLHIIGLYFQLKSCEDVSNPKYVKILAELSNISREGASYTSFVDNELLALGDEYLQDVMSDKRFANKKFDLAELVRSRPHILDDTSKQLMIKVGRFAGDFGDIFDQFDAVDVKFDKAKDGKGKEHALFTSNFSNMLESSDRVLRRNAWVSYYKSFISMANTIGTNYIAHVNADHAYAEIYKYGTTLEAELFDDYIDMAVYDRLIREVNNNLPLLHKYFRLKKKFLGLKDFTYYDMYLPLSKAGGKYTYDKAVDMVCAALKPMGDKYINLIHEEVNNRWVDVYPTEGKTTGGFEVACYGKHPYILLNNTGTLGDVFTFAHETGHAMHSYFSNANQPYELAEYPIILAEVASTTNEVLLLKYLYANAKTKKEKLYYLDKYLGMFKSTIFRQTMFSQFEDYCHKVVESGKGLSVTDMCAYYGDLNKQYHGTSVKHCREIEYEWLRIPHFYRSYYVFKYATGLTSAICIASNILNGVPGALDNYYKYLSSGGSLYALDTLKIAGVDLSTSHPYDVAFGEMKWALNELDKLCKNK